MDDIETTSEFHGEVILSHIGYLPLVHKDIIPKFDEYDGLHPKKWRGGYKVFQSMWTAKRVGDDVHFWTRIVDARHKKLCEEWLRDVKKFMRG